MSKLDYLTIVIVAICLAAVVFIMFRIYDLGETENPIDVPSITPIEQEAQREPLARQSEFEPPPTSSRNANKEQPPQRPVEKKAGNRSDREMKQTSASDGQPVFLVLAGSFRLRSGAEAEVTKLKNLGYGNAEVTLFNTGTYAAVLVDRFTDLAKAEQTVKDLQEKHNIEAYVHEKRTAAEND